MATYILSDVTEQYNFAAKSPVLDRVTFTIDHIHAGDHDICSTYEVVKFLVDKNIPVTVFMQATNPSNDYEYDRNNARMIYQLAPCLVTLGVHPLPTGNSPESQKKVHNVIRNIIKDVTGTFPAVLSYHGAEAGPEPHITFKGIKYARGILSAWTAGADDPKNTPVMVMDTVSQAFAYTSQRNAAGYSSTINVYTNELRDGSTKKFVFDTFIQSVVDGKVQAVSYISGMNVDFSTTVTPIPTPPPISSLVKPTSPANPNALGSLRLSAATEVGRRPVTVDLTITKINGGAIRSVSGVETQLFRLPAGQYRATASAGDQVITKDIDLKATQGVHHIFLMST